MNNSQQQQQQIANLQAQITQMQTMLANMQLSVNTVNAANNVNVGRMPMFPIPPRMPMPNMMPVSLGNVPPAPAASVASHWYQPQTSTGFGSAGAPVYKKPRTTFIKQGYVPSRRIATSPKKRARPSEEDREIAPYVLSDILQEGEDVTFRVIVGKEADGYPKFDTAIASYNGSTLKVTACESYPSLVGVESDKAGAILYQFMNGLFDSGILSRKFSIAPWKLCFVKRDGQHVSLNRLRKDNGIAAAASATGTAASS